MSQVKALFENEDVVRVLSENEELVEATMGAAVEFKETLKNFVLANPGEFLGENIAETIKNINVFTEAATAQYIHEVTSFNSNFLVDQKAIVENEINTYL
jgi:hypothetical protein